MKLSKKRNKMTEYEKAKRIVEFYEKKLTIEELSFKMMELERRLESIETLSLKLVPPPINPTKGS